MVHGDFHVEVPAALLNYERVRATEADGGGGGIGGDVLLDAHKPAMLNLYITLKPPFLVPQAHVDEKGVAEDDAFVTVCDKSVRLFAFSWLGFPCGLRIGSAVQARLIPH